MPNEGTALPYAFSLIYENISIIIILYHWKQGKIGLDYLSIDNTK